MHLQFKGMKTNLPILEGKNENQWLKANLSIFGFVATLQVLHFQKLIKQNKYCISVLLIGHNKQQLKNTPFDVECNVMPNDAHFDGDWAELLCDR